MPTASIPGRVYYTSDTQQIFRDNGSTWDNVTPASGMPTATAAYQAPLSTGAGSTYSPQQIIPFDATYTFWVSGGTVYARNESTGAVQFSGSDAAVVINNVLSAMASTGGTLFFKKGVYNLSSATAETVSPYTAYSYCVAIPAGTATNFPEFRFVGENTANGSQSHPETSGVLFNVTTAAETAAGTNTLVAFWARPNTNHDSDYPAALYWNGHILFENLGIQFQANTRGNEHAINALESGYLELNNVQAGFATVPTALAATNLKAFVSPGTPSDGTYMRNVYAEPGWGTAFEINTDHSVLIDTVAYQATTGYAVGASESRNASVIFHSGQWIHPQVYQCVNGITAGSYLASATQLDIFGLDLEYITTGVWAYSTGFTTGNLGGLLTWTNTQSNIGRGALTTPFPSGSGGNYAVISNGSLTLASEAANLFYAGPSSGSAANPTFRSIAPADLPVATTSAFGAVKPDGTTVTISGGVISASGGGGGSSLTLTTTGTSGPATLVGSTLNIPVYSSGGGGSSSYGFPFTVVQEKTQTMANATSFSMTFPQALQASGATAFLVIATDGGTSPTTPSGWTLIGSAGTSTASALYVYKLASASQTSTSWTTSSLASATVYFVEMSGTRVLDQIATGNNTTQLPYDTQIMPSVTATAGAAVFGFMAFQPNGPGSSSVYAPVLPLAAPTNAAWSQLGSLNTKSPTARSLAGMVSALPASGGATKPPVFTFIFNPGNSPATTGPTSYITLSIT